jgi:hypothetical protein
MAAKATNEDPPANVPPNWVFLRFVGEVNEFVSAKLGRILGSLKLLILN